MDPPGLIRVACSAPSRRAWAGGEERVYVLRGGEWVQTAMRRRARRVRWGPVGRGGAAAALCGALLLTACAHNHELLQKRVDTLEAQLSELQSGDRSVAVRLEDVENRLLLLRDELDTRQTVLYRDRHATLGVARTTGMDGAAGGTGGGAMAPAPAPGEPSSLPTVRLAPPEPPPPAPMAATDEPFAYDSLDSYGYRVSPDDIEMAPAPGGMDDAPVRVVPAAIPAPAPGPTLSPKEERRAAGDYKKAFELTQKGHFDKAQKALEKFVERWPTHQLADNALYWLGECLYAQKKFLEALQAFQRVIRDYPDGNKVPDSMLKTGLCYQNLGEPTQARKVLLQVAEIYPGSGAARIALERAGDMR